MTDPHHAGEVVVRPARQEEADAIGALTEQAYAVDGHLGHEWSEAYAAALRDAATRMAEATVLVASIDDEVVGAVTVTPAGGPLANVARPGELEVRMLAVAPTVRRRGVAAGLMAAAEEHARHLGLGTVVLSTGTDMVPAQRLYDRLGYDRRPERDWHDDVDLLAYVKELGPEAGPR